MGRLCSLCSTSPSFIQTAAAALSWLRRNEMRWDEMCLSLLLMMMANFIRRRRRSCGGSCRLLKVKIYAVHKQFIMKPYSYGWGSVRLILYCMLVCYSVLLCNYCDNGTLGRRPDVTGANMDRLRRSTIIIRDHLMITDTNEKSLTLPSWTNLIEIRKDGRTWRGNRCTWTNNNNNKRLVDRVTLEILGCCVLISWCLSSGSVNDYCLLNDRNGIVEHHCYSIRPGNRRGGTSVRRKDLLLVCLEGKGKCKN